MHETRQSNTQAKANYMNVLTADRKIIVECRVGSHLYGTNTPKSDEDFQGVFLPSVQDLFGMGNCPNEWTQNIKKSTTKRNQAGDVDRKYFSLKRFASLALEGQPGQLELLFSPSTVQTSPEWDLLVAAREHFLSRKSIAPFIGFALAQAHKAHIKGEHIRVIRKLREFYINRREQNPNATIKDTIVSEEKAGEEDFVYFDRDLKLQKFTNLEGFQTVRIAGRNYDLGIRWKMFYKSLTVLEDKFGNRSRNAAESGYDYKSLMNAYRLLNQSKELLQTGKMTFPRPPEEIKFYRELLDSIGKTEVCSDIAGIDFLQDLNNKIDELRQTVEPTSPLPEKPNNKYIHDLVRDMQYNHVFSRLSL